jgi:predicted dehydrogenase
MSKHKALLIGVGGMAGYWIHNVWKVLRERVTVSADIPVHARFTSTANAFAKADADFCVIVTPPKFHREAVELACARKLAILSEKPVADTWDDCVAISAAVRASGVRMMVTQNYRYMPRMLTLKQAARGLGAVNYVVARYTSDYRKTNAWGAPFRHEMRHALLIEGAIHHFDQIRNLTGSDCASISGDEWNPGQTRGAFIGSASFKGECSGLFVLRMTDGGRASYEGNNIATGKTNSWHREYYRVECEGGAAVLDRDDVVRVEERGADGGLVVREISTDSSAPYHGHTAIGAQFVDWLDGGPQPATVLADNLQSNAIMFGALRAAETNSVVDVRDLYRQAFEAA